MDLISDHPFWPINSGLIRSYPSLKADLQCEVLVMKPWKPSGTGSST